jgi:hypothetical protein
MEQIQQWQARRRVVRGEPVLARLEPQDTRR